MKKYIYIALVSALMLMWGCREYYLEDFESETTTASSNVIRLEDGRMLVTGTLTDTSFGEVSVSTRAAATEDNIVDGWCLVFGVDPAGTTNTYTDGSPMLLREELNINSNGTFFVTLPEYDETAFLRIVVNMTSREQDNLSSAVAWADCDGAYSTYVDDESNTITYLTAPSTADLATNGATITDDQGTEETGDDESEKVTVSTFGDYRYQSVGLDGIYQVAGYSAYLDTEQLAKDIADETIDVDDTDYEFPYENINETMPSPYSLATAFPMSSIGFVLSSGINESVLESMFESYIYLIRTCSKVTVTVSDDDFALKSLYVIDAAQEARVRSTVLSVDGTTGNEVSDDLGVPKDLGGTIDYLPLAYENEGNWITSVNNTTSNNDTTDPVYIYPNAGGYYDSDQTNSNVVNNDINPQYIIIKGRASGYDTDGYYKVALKGQYPLEYEYDEVTGDLIPDGDSYKVKTWSALTYDILRNTHFSIDLQTVDKPGYKTYADAADENNPASNISYSITIWGTDGRKEILVSNGTYYVELNTTRIYMAGYGSATDNGSGNSGSVEFTITPSTGNSTPAIYVQADYGVSIESCMVNNQTTSLYRIDLSDNNVQSGLFDVDSYYYDEAIAEAYGTWTAFAAEFYDTEDQGDAIHDVWYKVPGNNTSSDVKVNYSATYSGRIRLRIGDMLKFIPVQYDEYLVDQEGGTLWILEEKDFSYDDIEYLSLNSEGIEITDTSTDSNYSWFAKDGKVESNDDDQSRELRAMIYPSSGDGITKLYFWQDCEMDMSANNGTNMIEFEGEDGSYMDTETAVEYIVDLLDDGYTTIYFSGEYGAEDNVMDIDTVLDNINNNYDGLYSVDFTNVEFTLNNNEFKGNTYTLFQDNDQLYSVVMPSNIIKLSDGTFTNCTNLSFITFGSADDPSDSFETTGTLIKGCPNVIAITIYTKATSVKLSKMNDTGATANNGYESYYFAAADLTFYAVETQEGKETYQPTDTHVKEIEYTDGVSAGSYMYVFCDDDTEKNLIGDGTYISNLKYYFKYLSSDNEYYFNQSLYVISYDE